MQSSGSKEPPCHLGLTQASDPMQKLRHPGGYGKNRILRTMLFVMRSVGVLDAVVSSMLDGHLDSAAIETSQCLQARIHGQAPGRR